MKKYNANFILLFLVVLSCFELSAQERPNIVIFLADDLGYSSVGAYREDPDDPGIDYWDADYVATPNIDNLAAEGRMFTDANTPSSVCSPTRYAMLTGRYNWRTGKTFGTYGNTDPLSIEVGRPTIQGMLKQEGYNTAHIGKWHLGYQNSTTNFQEELSPGPNDIGFDYHWGVPTNNGDIAGVWVENNWVVGLNMDPNDPGYVERPEFNWLGRPMLDIPAPFREDEKTMGVMLEKGKSWIRQQDPSVNPYFMYYAFTAVHTPITPGQDFQGTSNAGPYGDFTQEIDHTIGEMVTLIDSLDNANGTNTIIIFTSDNGWDYYNNWLDHAEDLPDGFNLGGPFRGTKHTVWEAGFRVPYIIRWTGHVPAGSRSDEMMNLVDTYATVAAALGIDMPAVTEGAEDSYNFLPAWLGESYASPIRDHMILTSANGVVAVRQDDYKFINGIPTRPGVDTNDTSSRHYPEYRRQFYNIATDIGETTDIIGSNASLADDLENIFFTARDAGYSRDLGNVSVGTAVDFQTGTDFIDNLRVDGSYAIGGNSDWGWIGGFGTDDKHGFLYFDDVQLSNTGDQISLSIRYRPGDGPTGLTTTNTTNNAFRFGFFNNNGTEVGSNSGISNTNFSGYTGYYAGVSVSASDNPAIYQRNTGQNSLILGNIGSLVGTGSQSADMISEPIDVTYRILKTATGVEIRYTQNGTASINMVEYDNSSIETVFNTFAFGFDDTPELLDWYYIDGIKISYVVADVTEETYSLNVVNGTGDGDFPAGITRPITANAAPAGQEFDRWTGDTLYIADTRDPSTTVTMPAQNISVMANYIPSEPLPGGTALDLQTGADFIDNLRVDGSYAIGGNSDWGWIGGSGADDKHGFLYFNDVQLSNTGDQISLSMRYRPGNSLTGLTTTNTTNNAFRFGFFNNNGTEVGSNSGISNTNFSGYTGYYAGVSVSASDNPAIYQRNTGQNSLILGNIGSLVGTGSQSADMISEPIDVTYTIVKTATGVEIRYTQNGTASINMVEYDNSSTETLFNTFAFGFDDTPELLNWYYIDGIKVDYAVATEETYSLNVVNGTGDGDFPAGITRPITANAAPAGQEFDRWTGDTLYIADTRDPSTTVTMPAQNISVTANYIPSEPLSGGTALYLQTGTDFTGNLRVDGSYAIGGNSDWGWIGGLGADDKHGFLYFDDVQLSNTGDQISLSMRYVPGNGPTGLNTTNTTNNAFRFGFFNNNGTEVGSNSGISNTNFSGYTGYYAGVSISASDNPAIYQRNTGQNSLILGNIGSLVGTGSQSADMISEPIDVTYTIVKTATGVEIRYTQNGNASINMVEYDNSSTETLFNTFAFGFDDTPELLDWYYIDSIKVDYTVTNGGAALARSETAVGAKPTESHPANDNLYNEVEFSLEPNPADEEYVTVNINNMESEMDIYLYNLQGKILLHQIVDSDKVNININELKEGIYFVKVTNSRTSNTQKLVIK